MKRLRERSTQTIDDVVIPMVEKKEQSTQIGYLPIGSYTRKSTNKTKFVTIKTLLRGIICDKETAISWSMETKIVTRFNDVPNM